MAPQTVLVGLRVLAVVLSLYSIFDERKSSVAGRCRRGSGASLRSATRAFFFLYVAFPVVGDSGKVPPRAGAFPCSVTWTSSFSSMASKAGSSRQREGASEEAVAKLQQHRVPLSAAGDGVCAATTTENRSNEPSDRRSSTSYHMHGEVLARARRPSGELARGDDILSAGAAAAHNPCLRAPL